MAGIRMIMHAAHSIMAGMMMIIIIMITTMHTPAFFIRAYFLNMAYFCKIPPGLIFYHALFPQYNGWDKDGNYRRLLPPGSTTRFQFKVKSLNLYALHVFERKCHCNSFHFEP